MTCIAWHSFASLATNTRRLADSRMNRIPHVMTSFRGSKRIISEPADTMWRSTEKKWTAHCNPIHRCTANVMFYQIIVRLFCSVGACFHIHQFVIFQSCWHLTGNILCQSSRFYVQENNCTTIPAAFLKRPRWRASCILMNYKKAAIVCPSLGPLQNKYYFNEDFKPYSGCSIPSFNPAPHG